MTDSNRGYQQFFAELKRRRVFRVMAMYGVVAFIVLQIADIVFPILELPDWTLQFVLMLTILGFPIAIVIAWAFQATDEGIRRAVPATEEEIDEIIRAPASQRIRSGMLALVGVAALVLGAWWVGRQTAPTDSTSDGEASIAVLPCADMSPDGDQAHFSDGIAEELLNLLARIPDLHVAARTSSFSFKDQSLEITEIARRLGVAHLLECSVRTSEDEVRITAQLVRAHDGFHVWSETWDRPEGDIFAIQDEIAAQVVDQLKVTLLGATPTVREADPEAYALYLQARHVHRQDSGDSRERAATLYRQALAIDSAYAPAWAGLATAYRQLAFSGTLNPETGRPFDLSQAQAAVDRALAADPLNATAHSVLGQLALGRDNDLEAAAEHYSRSVELAPTDVEVLSRAGVMYWALGRLSEDIALLEYLASRDPLDQGTHFALGTDYLWAGRLDESIASLRTALSLSPGRRAAHFRIGTALLRKGQVERALLEMETEREEIWRLVGTALAYHTLGRAAEADSVLADLIAKGSHSHAFQIAYVMAWRNEPDRAFEWLDTAIENNDGGFREILVETLFENIHDDSRWVPFLERVGRAPEQLAAVEFDIPLPE